MEIRQLRSFQMVANLLSFNKAAGRLHYAQSSISAQIQTLEEEFGVQLFDRVGRKVQLTESGIQLLQYANKILDLVDETQSEVAGNKEPLGSLTVRIPESFGVYQLPAVIKEFHNRFPKVGLNFITCAHEGLEKDLRRGVTDLAFLLAESISATDIEVETLGFQSVVLAAGPDHPHAYPVVGSQHAAAGHEARRGHAHAYGSQAGAANEVAPIDFISHVSLLS